MATDFGPETPRREPGSIQMRVTIEHWPTAAPFRIAGNIFHANDCVRVELARNGFAGQGEAAGVYYLNDQVPRMIDQIEEVRAAIERGIDRARLQTLLPPGGARNALDCALWALDAAEAGTSVSALAGIGATRPLLTFMTIGVDTPEAMGRRAAELAGWPALKLKLSGDGLDRERVDAVRAARPAATIAVDANQGFDRAGLEAVLPGLVAAGVVLVEQPFPRDKDEWLDGLACPIPIAADESVQHAGDIAGCVGRYQVINIKLDKCGGLTEALAMLDACRAAGLDAMVGNMMGTSLAMAPSFLVGQSCAFVDLDGPQMLTTDRVPGARYEGGIIDFSGDIWGGL
jgi:L-alanine-DL-glutamate epimerase-like enolase superfamily enzyme